MIEGSASPYRITAAMTFDTATALFESGRKLFAANHGEVVLDLKEVAAADSSALAVILGWQRMLAANGRLRLTNLPASIRSLAQLYDVTGLLPE